MKLSELIKRNRAAHGYTMQDVADKSGLSKGTISLLERGYNEQTGKEITPQLPTLEKLAPVFGMTLSELLETIDDVVRVNPSKRHEAIVAIPVLGTVPAGIPIEAIEDIIDYEEIDTRLAATGKFFGLRIQGDSMAPKIMEGDIVIVKQQDDVDSGETAIVIIDGHDATCKRVIKNDLGLILQPTNPTYEPVQYDHESIKKTPIKIIGKVIELRRKF